MRNTEDVTDSNDFFFLSRVTVLSRLLGALCRCICDPQLNAASQEIRPAESLGQLLLFHLNSKSALQRITVALVLCKWAALQKVKSSDAQFYSLAVIFLCISLFFCSFSDGTKGLEFKPFLFPFLLASSAPCRTVRWCRPWCSPASLPSCRSTCTMTR